jgi:UDP-GlcNAc:undecaprenyl-phosphate GlcNAc-1-phosphate transferase
MLGGVALYAAFMLGYLVFAPGPPATYAVLGGGTLLFITGLVDDLLRLKPYTKLVVQLIVVAVAVYLGVRLEWTGSQVVNDVISICWLVGITNAINLLDNMDGLAGGVSAIACVFLLITFLMNEQPDEAMLAALMGGAVLGFLFFNFNPASIFMGDCGSMFLGFVLGGVSLLSHGRSRNLIAVLVTPVLILLTPIFDTVVVTLARKFSGRPMSQGGRDHTSHRLVTLGMSERRAVLLLYLFAAASGALALMVGLLRAEVTLLLVAGFGLVVLLLGLYLGKVRVYEAGERANGATIIRWLAEFTFKRRVFEVLLDVVLVGLAYWGAYLLRWDAELQNEQLAVFVKTLPLVIPIEMFFLLVGGVYRGIWRYTGIRELIVIAKSVLVGAAVSAMVVFWMYRMVGPSRGVFVLNGMLLFLLVTGSRLSFRLFGALIPDPKRQAHPNARPVLIYGAGDGGELLIREILSNPEHRYTPVGFVDDDERKSGKLIHGYRIFDSSSLPELIRQHGVNDVLVSSVKVSDSRLEHIREMGVSLRRMTIRIE